MNERILAKLEELIDLVRPKKSPPTEEEWLTFAERTRDILRKVATRSCPYPDLTGMVQAETFNANWTIEQKNWWHSWQRVK